MKQFSELPVGRNCQKGPFLYMQCCQAGGRPHCSQQRVTTAQRAVSRLPLIGLTSAPSTRCIATSATGTAAQHGSSKRSSMASTTAAVAKESGDGAVAPAQGQLSAICVFCGSAMGTRPEYEAAAVALGQQLVAENIRLVYGGGTVGLMGAIAKTVVQGLGDEGVIGVIPEALAPREVSGPTVGHLQVVPDMHTRKALMAKQADGFIAMPGGFGTMEELLEVITWQQLGFHRKPIGLLNVGGFFDPLVDFFQHCVSQGFIRAQHNTVIVSPDPQDLIQKMREFQPPMSVIEQALQQAGPDGINVGTAAPPAN